MLAYSTTNGPEDGPILSNPGRTRPISPVDVTLTGLKGATHRRRSKLATGEMGLASTVTLNVHRP